MFDAERERLLALPETPFPTEERVEVQVGKTPYARFDGNDYSVPHTLVGRSLSVLATPETVRIVDAATVVAEHPRCFERGRQVENPEHVAALVAHKRNARAHRAQDRLHQAAPACDALFAAVAENGGHLGVLTRWLLKLLELHGPGALERAVTEALAHPNPSLATVRHLIDLHRHAAGRPPPVALSLPDDPRLHNATVRPHDLAEYDQLHRDDNDDERDFDL